MIAAAITGTDNSSSRAVIAIDHTNSGICSGFMLFGFMLSLVLKFTAPTTEDTPARCREKMTRSTDYPACAVPLSGGG